VGKVDDVHHAEDDREAKGNQGKKKAHQDSLKECVENDHGHNSKMSNAKIQISNQINSPNFKEKIGHPLSRYFGMLTLGFAI
jgi:hypothetical protein